MVDGGETGRGGRVRGGDVDGGQYVENAGDGNDGEGSSGTYIEEGKIYGCCCRELLLS